MPSEPPNFKRKACARSWSPMSTEKSPSDEAVLGRSGSPEERFGQPCKSLIVIVAQPRERVLLLDRHFPPCASLLLKAPKPALVARNGPCEWFVHLSEATAPRRDKRFLLRIPEESMLREERRPIFTRLDVPVRGLSVIVGDRREEDVV